MRINLLLRLIKIEIKLFTKLFRNGDESCFDLPYSINSKIQKCWNKLSKEEQNDLYSITDAINNEVAARYIICNVCESFCKQECFVR